MTAFDPRPNCVRVRRLSTSSHVSRAQPPCRPLPPRHHHHHHHQDRRRRPPATMSFLCSSAPPRNDKLPKEWGGKNYGLLPNQWDVGMVEVPCREPACCLVACVCCPCVQYKMRMLVLDDDMTRYLCCQGYFGPCCCFKPGEMGERSCPHLCLCAEVFCCESCAVSATRLTVMDQYDIASDPCGKYVR